MDVLPRAALGILYAEDFSLEHVVPPPDPEPPPLPAITQADVDAACIRAVQAAQAAWAESAAERRTEALASISAGLKDANDSQARAAEAVADTLARATLAMVAGMLPHFCRAHGDEEVRAIVQKLAPILGRRARLVVRVHPGLIETLADDVIAIDDSLAPAIDLRPANLPPGNAHLTWEDGSLVRDTAALRSAMQEALARLGLDAGTPSVLEPCPGSLALAQ